MEPASTNPAWRIAGIGIACQVLWLAFTSISQSTSVRVEQALDGIGFPRALAPGALDAWVLLPIVLAAGLGARALGRLPGDAARTRARRPALAALGLATIACAVFFLSFRPYLLHRFAAVRDGVLYRSAQMGVGTLAASIDRHGIRTLVSLRDDPHVLEREHALAARMGVRFEHIPMSDTAAGVERFLALVRDSDNHPVLAHCEYGIARTGVASAAFRIELDGWDNARALAEARRFGGYDTMESGSRKREFILTYQPVQGARAGRP